MTLTILFPNDARIYSFPVEGNENKEIKIPGHENVTLRMLEFLPNANLSPQGYVNDSAAPPNPALKFRLTDADGREQEETVLASRALPLTTAERGIPWDYSYVIFSGVEHRRGFLAVQGPDEKLHYRCVRSDGTEESGEVEMGKSYPLGYENLSLEFSDYMPRAKMARRFEPAPSVGAGDNPCILVRVESRAGEQETIVPFSGKESVTFGDGATAEIRQQRRELPFTLELVKSRAVIEPGGTAEIGRESDVVGSEKSGGKSARKTVRVNEPLLIAGYRVFQVTPPGRPGSAFWVVRDPGLNIIYAGCVALIAGIVVVFFTRVSRKEKPLA